MTKLAWLSVAGLALRTIHDYIFFKRGREIGRLVHNETLKKILFAKVNLFFDVTPIGKIITIFTSDLNIFYRAILDCPKEIMKLVCEVFVTLSLIFTITYALYVYILFALMAYIVY